jgi:hypothetical protein
MGRRKKHEPSQQATYKYTQRLIAFRVCNQVAGAPWTDKAVLLVDEISQTRSYVHLDTI